MTEAQISGEAAELGVSFTTNRLVHLYVGTDRMASIEIGEGEKPFDADMLSQFTLGRFVDGAIEQANRNRHESIIEGIKGGGGAAIVGGLAVLATVIKGPRNVSNWMKAFSAVGAVAGTFGVMHVSRTLRGTGKIPEIQEPVMQLSALEQLKSRISATE